LKHEKSGKPISIQVDKFCLNNEFLYVKSTLRESQ